VTVAVVGRVIEHRALQYRRTFRASIFSSFLSPTLFLAAMGLGLGTYVDQGGGNAALGDLSYVEFLAPGLLAATLMQGAAFESTFPIMGGLVWNRVYHAMYATPIEARDVALGNLAWIAVRLTMVAVVFTLVMAVFGAVRSPLALLAIPAGVLTGMAFAGPIMAFSATQRTPEKFNAVFRFGITPLFLFSGTFFPIENLPEAIRPVAWLSPLFHGVELTRGLALGTAGDAPMVMLVHVLVLSAIAVAGAAAAVVTIRRRLIRG
jgi:lipooligosaccharide transport system permease protein